MSDQPDAPAIRRQKTGRSPAYPNFGLQAALGKTKALHDQEGAYEAPLPAVAASWGYSEKSSGFRQALATLRYFGLIEVSGEGDARKVKVSEMARRILLDQREDQTEKKALITKAALMPTAHRTLYKRYPTGLASDASVTHCLVFEEGFTRSAADELLAEFKETAAFCSLYEPSTGVDKQTHPVQNQAIKPEVAVGDRIQWNSQGVDQFPKGALVLGFSDDGEWIFTDQGTSGIPVNEVRVMETSSNSPPTIPPHLANGASDKKNNEREEEKIGVRKAVFPVEDGDVTLIFPDHLSADGLAELGQYLDIFLKKEQKKK